MSSTMQMERVDNHILSNILTHLNYDDLCNAKAVNRHFRSISKETYPNLQRFFDLIKSKKHKQPIESSAGDILFPYSKTLSYSEIEYWADVGTRLYQNNKNRGLFNAIVYKLSKLNHERSDFTNQLTHEQQRVIDCPPRPNRNIVVQAFAGTGKTTTLHEYAKRWTKRMLYITYNKSLAEESKLKFRHLTHVHAMTIHSLAYAHFVRTAEYVEIGNITVDDLYKHLYKDHVNVDPELLRTCKSMLDKFNRYVNSDDPAPNDEDVELIWNLMFVQKELKITHDAYLKHYQLQKVKLDYDVILLDEVQDCTDCVLDIVLSQQNCARVFVGDKYQTIYSFKHVNDPFGYIMHSASGRSAVFKLSVSFRMGFDLMYFTNLFLKTKYGENEGFSRCKRLDTRITNENCHGSPDFRFGKCPKKTVILCRYNVSMLKCIFDLCSCGYTFDCYGKTINCEKELEIVRDFVSLKEHRHDDVKHPKLKPFRLYDTMVNHFQISNNNKWKDRISMFEYHGERLLELWDVTKTQFNKDSDFIVTTAHQSKGAEFDHVMLYNDFQINNRDAVNICYVAMTRARKTLYINKLLADFFEKYKHKVYYNEIKYSETSRRCHLCARSTNAMLLTEKDPSATFFKECDVYVYSYTCNSCHKNLL